MKEHAFSVLVDSAPIKIAYKGFDKNLRCKNHQFAIGEIASKPSLGRPPRLCSNEGYHYCNELHEVFEYYPLDCGNRYCKVEIHGEYTDDEEKSITYAIKLVQELTPEEIDVARKGYEEKKLENRVLLPSAVQLQKNNPNIFFGGSFALFLYGIRLERFHSGISDLDVILPYYSPLKDEDGDELEEVDGKSFGNDYDVCYLLDDETKVDVKINPKQRYKTIKYKHHSFKVALLEDIMEAKWRYVLNGQKKHKDDCYEMILPKNKK